MSNSCREHLDTDDGGHRTEGASDDDPSSNADAAMHDESEDRAAADPGGSDASELETVEPQRDRLQVWAHAVRFGVVPAVTILLAAGAGWLQWLDTSARGSQIAATQSVRAATEDSIAMLSYRSETVERDMTAALDRLTGPLRDSYMRLINEVVIPSAKGKRISAVTTVPAAASVSATRRHAVVLVFVNQTTTSGSGPPTTTASRVRVTLEKIDRQWLVSQFQPI